MNLLKRVKFSDYPLLIVMGVAAALRLVNLGYSDFQGDEIKALFLPPQDKSIVAYLLSQRKGPIQFLITYLLKFLDPNYTNQFLIRLPFALAGIFAVYVLYKLVLHHFGKKVAFYSTLFFATNGFFVAFSRIAQYQSFVILFDILALYYFSHRRIYYGFAFWALSILSHYDGIFIFPFVLYLLNEWRIASASLPVFKLVKKLFGGTLLFIIPLAVFYVPFVQYISAGTLNYWEGRLTGDVSNKLSSSYYLFTVYQPIYVIHIYILLSAFALLGLLLALSPNLIKKLFLRIKILSLSMTQAVDLYINQIKISRFFLLLFWFSIPFLFWELVVYIPGTHIYTYLMPSFILIGVGLAYGEAVFTSMINNFKYIKATLLTNCLLFILFTFITMQAYMVFVDNYREYPWQDERFFVWTFNKPTPIYHLSMFGFPYFRDWENIGKYISDHPGPIAYSTNERESIARHYISLEKDTDLAGYYVYIRHPQSFTNEITNEKVLYWAGRQPPVYTLSKTGTDLVNIYYMPSGTLEEIKKQGF